jgi:hypothetical protein
LRVLVVGAFDPCAVHLRQRKWLAPLGIEIKIAVREKYWAEHDAVDWVLPADHDAVAEYARRADLLVYLPAISQPWSSAGGERVHEVQPFQANAALFLFHGSVNAAANMQHYAEHYGRLGTVAATTLDYVAGMGCEFVPSIVDVTAKAALRQPGEALRVIHAPSDPRVCRTSEFRHVAQGRCQLQYMNDASHAEVIKRKAMAHAGYDHLRGAFSINSLENAAIGLVNLVGMSDEATAAGERLGVLPDWPKVKTMDDVRYWLERLDKDPRETSQWQMRGYEWFQQNWHPAQVAERIAGVYRKAAKA